MFAKLTYFGRDQSNLKVCKYDFLQILKLFKIFNFNLNNCAGNLINLHVIDTLDCACLSVFGIFMPKYKVTYMATEIHNNYTIQCTQVSNTSTTQMACFDLLTTINYKLIQTQ